MWGAAIVGAALAVLALRDVFHTLWHPSGKGWLSSRVASVVWRVTGRLGPGARGVAGPTVMLTVIVVWAGLVVLAGAVAYLPHVAADGFVYASSLDPADRSTVVDAVYVSAVVLSTLGFGDVVPVEPGLRIATAVQALIGFSLLTAGVTWITQVQAALVRRRTAARLISALDRADEQAPGGQEASDPSLTSVEQVTRDLVAVHVDMGQTMPTYYFVDRDPEASLAVVLPWTDSLAQRARGSDDARLRAAGNALDVALGDLVDLLDRRFLDVGGERDAVLRRYREDHGLAS